MAVPHTGTPPAAPSCCVCCPPAHPLLAMEMRVPCKPCCSSDKQPRAEELVLSSRTQRAAAFHSCLLRPSVHGLNHASPSYTRGIPFFQGDVQSGFLQLFFPELVPGNSGSSLVTAVHLPPSSGCSDFPSTRLSYCTILLPGLSYDPQTERFLSYTNITLKKKLPPLPLSNPKTGVPMRGCDPQTAELPFQSHWFVVTARTNTKRGPGS